MDFKVVTWNILADAFINPERYPNSPPEALEPAFRRALVLDTIAAQAADIYLLQEVERDAFDAIEARLGRPYASHFAPRPKAKEGSAIFARAQAFEMVKTATRPYRATKGRGVAQAHLALLQNGPRQLALASLHLAWEPPGTPSGTHVGRAQLLEVLDHRAAFAPEGCPWLIGGDFNAISESPPIHAALERGLRLSCRSQRPWDTCNINRKRRKIDYLLYNPATLVPRPGVLPRLGRETPMPSMTWPSDHLAVEVAYAWA